MTVVHDPTEDQRIAAVVREHERSQEPAVMQNTVDTTATATATATNTDNVQIRNLPKLSELTPEQLIALSNDELFAIITPKRKRERELSPEITPEVARLLSANRAAIYCAYLPTNMFERPEQLADRTATEGPAELAPEAEPARALPRQRPLAVKLARRVGIVCAWLLLIAVAVAVCTVAQVSVVLGQQALVSDGVGPLAAAGVAAICSIACGLGALAVLGKVADKLTEIEP